MSSLIEGNLLALDGRTNATAEYQNKGIFYIR